jgi:hypothetical protein
LNGGNWSAYLTVRQSQNKVKTRFNQEGTRPFGHNTICREHQHKHQISRSGGHRRFASVSNLPVLHCGFRRR